MSAANSLRLPDREFTVAMSIDARLTELKRDLARQLRNPRTRRREEQARVREADSPEEIAARGWKDIIRRAWAEISDQSLFLIAGGVTYAVLLALFPGLYQVPETATRAA
jgi:membrane protein